MWLVSCRKQGMLTQGPAPDPKCKLVISSFLTLPRLLDFLICTRNAMFIVLLLQTMLGCDRWEGGGGGHWFILRCGLGDRGGYYLTVFVFSLCFCILLPHVLSPFIQVARWWWLLCLFLCFFFIFFVSTPFN